MEIGVFWGDSNALFLNLPGGVAGGEIKKVLILKVIDLRIDSPAVGPGSGWPEKGAAHYALAEAKALEVINNSQYSLVPDYKSLFDVSKKNSTESLFEVQYKKGGTGTGSPWNNDFAPRFSSKEVILVGDKGGFNAPTPSKYIDCLRTG